METVSACLQATIGTIRLFAEYTDGATTIFEGHAGGIADAGWPDTITISAPVLSGQAGLLTLSLFVAGNIHAPTRQEARVFPLGSILFKPVLPGSRAGAVRPIRYPATLT